MEYTWPVLPEQLISTSEIAADGCCFSLRGTIDYIFLTSGPNTMKILYWIPVLLMISCSSTSPTVEQQYEQVRVQNDNWLDVNVYILSFSGIRQKLGFARSMTSITFTIPSNFGNGASVYLHVDPIGSEDIFETDQFSVSPSQVVILKVGQNIQHSSWYIDNAAPPEE